MSLLSLSDSSQQADSDHLEDEEWSEENSEMEESEPSRSSRSYELPFNFERHEALHKAFHLLERAKKRCDGVSISAALLLLKCSHWDECLLSESFQNEREELLERSHLSTFSLQNSFLETKSEKEVECPLCFDVVKGDDKLTLPCGHTTCLSCLKDYLHEALSQPSPLDTKCFSFGCLERVQMEIFEYFAHEEDWQRYQQVIAESFIQDSKRLAYCPRATCTKVCRIDESKVTVECECREKFCAFCKTAAHAPASCAEALEWRAKDTTINLDAKYLLEKTKPCPKCQCRITREGGCLFVTCTQCLTPFCWHCGKGDHHVWQCERKTYEHDQDENRNELNRYLYFFEKYFLFQGSQRTMEASREKVMAKMNDLVEAGSSLSAVQFLLEALQCVIDARRVLSWSFVHAFFLPVDSNALRLFEFKQKELEKFAEQLNELVESPISTMQSKRHLVLDYTKALTSFFTGFEADLAKTKERVKESSGNKIQFPPSLKHIKPPASISTEIDV